MNYVPPVHAVKARQRCGGKLHTFLTSVSDGGGLSSSRCISLPPGEIPRYLHGPHRGSGRFEEEKHVLSQPGIELRTVQPQASATTLTSDR